ncbi:SulP family inorganic anion transporter [Blastococcus deserti]|uniref:SulP family inorganic anion transporter n=1 Tax=Blastococcus deserti TaxID=2259033 RepID=A0ABW4XG35_9ACTN
MPTRGDVVAGLSVALILLPQGMAYAQLAGLPPIQGLYAAAAAPIFASFVGSSPYLQTGPVAMTSLLTLGALTPLAPENSTELVAYAAVLAVVVGVVRLLLGLLRAGAFAYLLSEPAINGFLVGGAILIVASQVPPLLDLDSESANPLGAAAAALARPAAWELAALCLGLATVLFLVLSRRLGPLFPAVPLVAAAGVVVGGLTAYPGDLVGDIPTGLPPVTFDLMWSALPQLLVPGAVIAIVGFAEPVAIARRFAAEDRQHWHPDRELIGQGLANVAAGFAGGYPTGGSLSRSSLNRAAGATTRWSGAITGLLVLAALPIADVLSPLPRTVLAGLVLTAALPLLDPRVFSRQWRLSRPQTGVAVATFVATLAFAPRIERGVLVGVALAVAVHLWRELRLHVQAELTVDGTLHLRPQGVLYYASAPALQDQLVEVVACHPGTRRIVLHLNELGRIDLSGMLTIRAVLQDLHLPVTLGDVPQHGRRLVSRVLPEVSLPPDDDPRERDTDVLGGADTTTADGRGPGGGRGPSRRRMSR